jgi:hypothetical protein
MSGVALNVPSPHVLPWLEARWRGRPGHARRWHRQPFPWTRIYEFIPEDGEAVLLAGLVLNLGLPRHEKLDTAIRKRTHFPAKTGRRQGLTRPIPGTPSHLKLWDFLGDDGVAAIVPDPAIEVWTWRQERDRGGRKLRSVTRNDEVDTQVATLPNPAEEPSKDGPLSAPSSEFGVTPGPGSGLRACPVCERLFPPSRRTQVVCSPRCRIRRWRAPRHGDAATRPSSIGVGRSTPKLGRNVTRSRHA